MEAGERTKYSEKDIGESKWTLQVTIILLINNKN